MNAHQISTARAIIYDWARFYPLHRTVVVVTAFVVLHALLDEIVNFTLPFVAIVAIALGSWTYVNAARSETQKKFVAATKEWDESLRMAIDGDLQDRYGKHLTLREPVYSMHRKHDVIIDGTPGVAMLYFVRGSTRLVWKPLGIESAREPDMDLRSQPNV